MSHDPTIEHTHESHQAAIARCAFIVAVPLVVGSLGFWWIESEWSLWDSLYFTLVTITTVGYGDRGLSLTGERFAAILLICGIGAYTYALGTLIQLATQSELRWRWKMQRTISELRNHAVICGYGRMGKSVSDNLKAKNFPFVVIDCEEDNYEAAINDGHLALHGSASEDSTLLNAGVRFASVVVCAVDSDAENTFIAMSVRELSPDSVIASRCERESSSSKLKRAGASVIVSPHEMAGGFLSNSILNPHLTQLLGDRGVEASFALAEISIEADSDIVGETVLSYGRQEPSIVFVAAAQCGETPRIRPQSDRTFSANDVVIVASDRDSIERMRLAASALEAMSC